MSLKNSIKDGTGTNKEAKVDESGKQKENSLWVNLTGLSQGVVMPVGPSATGTRLLGNDARFSLDGDGAVFEMNVISSPGSPDDYYIKAQAGKDLIITQIILFGLDNGMKLANFYGQNSPLTNGIEISWKSDDNLETLDIIKSTNDVDLFSSIAGFTFRAEAGGDNAKGIREFSPALVIRAENTFGNALGDDDFLRIRIQDDLSNVLSVLAYVRGVSTDPGEL